MKAAVFDFDGTLVDSMGFWSNLARNYLYSIGIVALNDLEKSLEKLTVSEGILYMKEKYKIGKTKEEIQKEMDELLFKYYREEVKLKPDVVELLNKLKGKGITIAIASVIHEKLIESVLKRYNIENYFEFIQTCENTGLSKGDRKFFDLLPKRLNLNPDEIYMFEDTLYPMVSAKKAGLKVVGVEDDSGLKNKGEIVNLSDLYIEDFNKFLDLIDKGTIKI
ncbi:MAG: HAD family hydrolase [Tissierella sp.]|uniref:HAD family hydrolase n=1 Tax=Tissierella sp. TaxID=41274 RepID=UPI003F95AE54